MLNLDSLNEEQLKELSSILHDDTLDKIRSGIPVSFEQALAAVAFKSLEPPKRSWWHRLWHRIK